MHAFLSQMHVEQNRPGGWTDTSLVLVIDWAIGGLASKRRTTTNRFEVPIQKNHK